MPSPLSSDEKLSVHSGDPLSSDDATTFWRYCLLHQHGLSILACSHKCSLIRCETYSSVLHVILVSKFARVPPCFSVLFHTPIGLATLMIDALSVVMLSFWGQISLHGVRASKQATVSHSSIEAEYKALANATVELIWI
jgi:hypothetical protein